MAAPTKLVRNLFLAGAMVLATASAYAAPDYCGPDGIHVDTATDPDSILLLAEVTLNLNPSDDCFGVVLDNKVDVSGLWDGGWTGEAKSDGGETFVLAGVTFAVEVAGLGTTGFWELSLTGDPQTITVDLVVALKSSDRYAAYFIDDVTFVVPSESDGTYQISYFNNGGRLPNLSHLSLFARLEEGGGPPTEAPEPGSLLLLGLGFAALALVRRRRRI